MLRPKKSAVNFVSSIAINGHRNNAHTLVFRRMQQIPETGKWCPRYEHTLPIIIIKLPHKTSFLNRRDSFPKYAVTSVCDLVVETQLYAWIMCVNRPTRRTSTRHLGTAVNRHRRALRSRLKTFLKRVKRKRNTNALIRPIWKINLATMEEYLEDVLLRIWKT